MCTFFFFKQKTAYEMRISDWSSDVCSSDLSGVVRSGIDRVANRGQRLVVAVDAQHRRNAAYGQRQRTGTDRGVGGGEGAGRQLQIGRASCRERVCQYV